MRLERLRLLGGSAVAVVPLHVDRRAGRRVPRLAARRACARRARMPSVGRTAREAPRSSIVRRRVAHRWRSALMPRRARRVARAARRSAWLFYALDRAHRRIAARERRRGVSRRGRPTSSARIVRGAFAHFGRLLFELLKFSTLSPEADAGARRVRGRGARPPGATRRARACCSSPATSASGSCRRWCTRCGCRRWRCWRARSTTRALNDLLEQIRTRTGNTRHLPAGHDPPRDADAAGRARRRRADRSAHP